MAVFLVLARILDKHELGLFSATIAITAVAELFADNGLGDAVVQVPELDDGLLSAAMVVNLGFGLLLSAGLVFASPALSVYFSAPGLAPLLNVMVLSLVLNAASYVPQSLFRRQFEYRWLAVRALIAMGLSGATGVAMALLGFGAWSMVAQAIVFAAVNCAIVWAKPPFNPFVRPAFARFGALFRISLPILLGRVLYYICARAIELVVLYRFGPVGLSLYIIGSRVYFVCTQLLTAVLVDVAFSTFSRLAGDREALAAAFFSTLRSAMAVTAPVFLGLTAIAPELCHVAFGSKGPDAAPYLIAVSVFGVLQVLQFLIGSTLGALGRPAVATWIQAGQAVLAALVMLPPWPIGPVALVALNAATLLVMVPANLIASQRIAGMPIMTTLRTMMPPLAAGVAMVAAVSGARTGIVLLVPSPFWRMTLLIVVGGIVFIGLLAALSPSTVRAVVALARRRRNVHERVPHPA